MHGAPLQVRSERRFTLWVPVRVARGSPDPQGRRRDDGRQPGARSSQREDAARAYRTFVARQTPADCIFAGQRAFRVVPPVGFETLYR